MTLYNIHNMMAMDPDEVVGVAEVDDNGVIAKVHDEADGYQGLFKQYIEARQPFSVTMARHSLYRAVEKGAEDKGKPAEETVSLADDESEIAKIDPDKRLVFGWAYVTHNPDGQVNVDKSGDFIDSVDELETSAYDFILKSRNGDTLHDSKVVSTIVESVVFTPEKIEKMGIAPGTIPTGWWVGFRVNDDQVWDRVKKGELTAFSIGGRGTRKKVEE